MDDQEFIFLKPEFEGYWSYQIDNGKRHTLRQDDVYPWVKTILQEAKERIKIVDIISRNQPFLIILKAKKVKELHIQEETGTEYRKRIMNDLSDVSKGLDTEGTIFKTLGKAPDRYSSKREDSTDRLLKRYIRSEFH